jgi:hypothetical protein
MVACFPWLPLLPDVYPWKTWHVIFFCGGGILFFFRILIKPIWNTISQINVLSKELYKFLKEITTAATACRSLRLTAAWAALMVITVSMSRSNKEFASIKQHPSLVNVD